MEEVTKTKLKDLQYRVNGAAIEVHKRLGGTLLESIYHEALKRELRFRKIPFATQVSVPVIYRDEKIKSNLRCDLLIDDILVVELKAVEELHPMHYTQLLTYMKLLNKPEGVLFNFKCQNLYKFGQQTLVNELYRNIPD